MANDQKPQQQGQQKQVSTVSIPPSPGVRSAPESAETLLEAAGWERVGTNSHGEGVWQDPDGEGSKASNLKGVTIRLPHKNADSGEKEVIVHQATCPPCSWKYVTSAAMRIQKQRESANGGPTETPQMRLGRLGARLDGLEEVHGQLLLELEPLTRRPVPEKRENLVAEVGALKAALAAALGRAKVAREARHPQSAPVDVAPAGAS